MPRKRTTTKKKVTRRRRPSRTTKAKDMGLNIMRGATAFGGGALGSFVTGMFEDAKSETMQNLAPWFTAGLGLAGTIFLNDDLKPAAYGMLGASGAEVMEDWQGGSPNGYVPNMTQQVQRYNALNAMPMMGILR